VAHRLTKNGCVNKVEDSRGIYDFVLIFVSVDLCDE
jgi:hypothetical protein